MHMHVRGTDWVILHFCITPISRSYIEIRFIVLVDGVLMVASEGQVSQRFKFPGRASVGGVTSVYGRACVAVIKCQTHIEGIYQLMLFIYLPPFCLKSAKKLSAKISDVA